MFNFHKILFFMTLIFGTLMAISSYSWLSMWMGLEINLLSIIPLLSSSKNLFPSEAALKYFITQALASSILLLSLILNFNLNELISYWSLPLSSMFNSALLIKIGAAPFHAWFPEVIEGLNWNYSLLMLTWQKIAPMILISYNFSFSIFFILVILFSVMISGLLGLNQISLRKILAYSSINHISWMLASMLHSLSIWMLYFLIYSIITFSIITIFKQLNIFLFAQFLSSLNSNKYLKFLTILNFLSLGGLPPFLGFFPKWIVINNLIYNDLFFLSLFLILFTLNPLFFYLRICFSSLLINSNETITYLSFPKKFLIFFLNFVSLSGLLIVSFLINFI